MNRRRWNLCSPSFRLEGWISERWSGFNKATQYLAGKQSSRVRCPWQSHHLIASASPCAPVEVWCTGDQVGSWGWVILMRYRVMESWNQGQDTGSLLFLHGVVVRSSGSRVWIQILCCFLAVELKPSHLLFGGFSFRIYYLEIILAPAPRVVHWIKGENADWSHHAYQAILSLSFFFASYNQRIWNNSHSQQGMLRQLTP